MPIGYIPIGLILQTMKKFFASVLILTTLGLCTNSVYGQQDAQFTNYMYNPLSVNPAYAGTRDVLSIIGLYRSQWVGLDGAPTTMNFGLHSPVGKRVGLGLNITNDEIFLANETYIDLAFSYTLDVSEKGKLSLGVKGGGHLLDINSNRANTGEFDLNDELANIDLNRFSPQVGAGAYYYTDKFYLGFSVPNILETEHFDESSVSSNSSSSATATERVNYYLMTGYVFDITSDLQFKPATLFKLVQGAPLQVDLSANFLIHDRFTVGAAYRWSAALSGLVGFQVSDQILIGFAYDWETTELQQYNDGSFEVFLRFELFNRNEGLKNPRFF